MSEQCVLAGHLWSRWSPPGFRDPFGNRWGASTRQCVRCYMVEWDDRSAMKLNYVEKMRLANAS